MRDRLKRLLVTQSCVNCVVNVPLLLGRLSISLTGPCVRPDKRNKPDELRPDRPAFLDVSNTVLKTDGRPSPSKRGFKQALSISLLGAYVGTSPNLEFLDRPRSGEFFELAAASQLLTEGGDGRIVCAPDGSNRYGCSAFPEPEVLAYGSSTASTISPAGFAAADALRSRLVRAAAAKAETVTYQEELDRVRRQLRNLCGLDHLSGLEIIFGASGTDLHLFASQLMVEVGTGAPLIIRVEAAETGRGVPDALAGRHFGDCAPLGDAVVPNFPLDCGRPIDVLEVPCRALNGKLRPAATVDAEVESAALKAMKIGRRVLLTLVDVSKTGLLSPSPAMVDALRSRFPDQIDVLVDACQFRLAPSTLRAYLEHNFLVAITGSKFVTGPTFCGALLVPAGAGRRLKTRTLPRALRAYSARAEWPQGWAAQGALKNAANFGLLLRWEAALAELRAFRQLPEDAIRDFLMTFAGAVERHFAQSPAFEFLPSPALDRGAFGSATSWDQLPTIFSFLLVRRSPSGEAAWLNQDETKKVHELLRDDLGNSCEASSRTLMASRCQLGQPVPCGTRDGIPVSALRLCASTRLMVDAVSPTGRGAAVVVAEALTALDKAALLASRPATLLF
jgi:hypothetical protein